MDVTALLLPVPPAVLAIALCVTAVAAALQGTIGFGFAVLSVPVLSLVDPVLAPVPQLLVSIPLTVSMTVREREHVDLRGMGWVLLGRLPGAAIGVALLKVAEQRWLDVLLSMMVLLAIGLLVSGADVKRRPASELGAGVLSGVMSMVASTGGPPLALLYRNEAGATIRGTLAAIFTIGLFVTLVARIVAREITWLDLQLGVLYIPALLAGLWASKYLHGKVEGRPLRIAILIVSATAAIGLLARAAL